MVRTDIKNRPKRKLTRYLITVICITVIPIDILALAFSTLIMRDARSSVKQSYEWQLNVETAKLDAELTELGSKLTEFDINLDSTVSRQDDTTTRNTIINSFTELQAFIDQNTVLDAAALVNKGNGESYVAYDTASHKVGYDNLVREYLKEAEYWSYKGYEYRIVRFEDTDYLQISIASSHLVSLFLISEENLFNALQLNQDQTLALALTQDQENVLSDSGENLVPIYSDYFDFGYQLELGLPEYLISAGTPVLYRILFVVALVSVLIIPLALMMLRKMILKPGMEVVHAMEELRRDNLDYRIEDTADTEEFQYLIDSYNAMADSIRTMKIEAYEQEMERARLNDLNMRLQVNPHMLLNSLNMIYSLSLSKKNEAIQEYSKRLMKYFRYILRRNHEFVTVKEELEFCADYLEISKIRFPGAFTTSYSCDPEAEEIRIPAFLIENFVENAIKYGLIADQTVEIITIVTLEDRILHISIVDTGCGMAPEVLAQLNAGQIYEDNLGRHVGVWNSRKRMEMFYGTNAAMRITSAPGEGTQVYMSLPIDDLIEPEEEEE